MSIPTFDHRARRRTRAAATVISTLAAGAALAGAAGPTGVADAAASHAGTGRTYRVLSITSPSGRGDLLQYTTRHARYRLERDYDGDTLLDITWQREIRKDGHREANLVVIDPRQKSWFEQRNTYGPLPPHPFGIRSTARQVARAIRDGKARPHGLGVKDGQRVRLLTVSQSKNVRSDLLWVNAVTDRPVAEAKTFIVGRVRSRTELSHWENVSLPALNQIRDEPKVPAGYTIGHPKKQTR